MSAVRPWEPGGLASTDTLLTSPSAAADDIDASRGLTPPPATSRMRWMASGLSDSAASKSWACAVEVSTEARHTGHAEAPDRSQSSMHPRQPPWPQCSVRTERRSSGSGG
eukprot:CAMPEP_0198693404 /NCGR_PEP_ID=MMETSP1468-20131203/249625_1 /TAXON_ID=1461545 /ORGANISM="Mantoniella sp, Strain CCMP1436" /LENGTH=109 /DNA_ID=CAMNT_0044448035 /DNA_START=29 /DNA_END=354 /DNA_ORIENTATION=-